MEITESASAPTTAPVAYSDEELRAILSQPADGHQAFPFNFEKLWPALGYTRKDNAVCALKTHTEGADWVKAAEATNGRPRILYWVSVDCAKLMAFHAPDQTKTLARKFLARCTKIENEFKRMLLARMAEDVQRIQPAPAAAELQVVTRKRLAETQLMELEVADRRVEVAGNTLKFYEAAKAAMGTLDGRDTIRFKDMTRNLVGSVDASHNAQQLHIEPAASAITTAVVAAAAAGVPQSTQPRIEQVADATTAVVAAAAAPPIGGATTRPTAQRPREWALSAWLPEHGHGRPTLEKVQLLGRFVVAAFRRHSGGASPPQRESYVDGATRLVYHYTEADAAIIEEGIADMKHAGKW